MSEKGDMEMKMLVSLAFAVLLAQVAQVAAQTSCPKPTGKDYSGQNLTDQNFSRQDLTGANFTNATLNGAQFAGATLKGAVFAGAQATADASPHGPRPGEE